MHSLVASSISNSKEKLSLSVVGAKIGVTVVLAFSPRRSFPVWVAKIGAGPEISSLLRRERDALELMAPHAEKLGGPKMIEWSEEGGSSCLLLSGVDGFSVHFGLPVETRKTIDERCFTAALLWLKCLRECIPPQEIERKLGANDDLEWLERQSSSEPAFGRLLNLLQKAGDFPKTASHGDFWCGNLLFNQAQLAVIDWEGLSARHALHDVLSLLTHCAYRSGTKIELDLTRERFFDLYFSKSGAARFARDALGGIEPSASNVRTAFYAFIASSLRFKGGRYRESWLEILRELDQRGFPGPWPDS